MNTLTSFHSHDSLAASRQALQEFGRHFDYDVCYLLELADASPEAFRAFEAAMPMSRVQKVAPVEAVQIAKIAGMRAQDCGPCTELCLKIAREAGVAEEESGESGDLFVGDPEDRAPSVDRCRLIGGTQVDHPEARQVVGAGRLPEITGPFDDVPDPP